MWTPGIIHISLLPPHLRKKKHWLLQNVIKRTTFTNGRTHDLDLPRKLPKKFLIMLSPNMLKSSFQSGMIINRSSSNPWPQQTVHIISKMARKMPELCSRCQGALFRGHNNQHWPYTWHCHGAYHEWKHLDDEDKMWSKLKEHFNEVFNKLQELNEITARGTGFGASMMELTPTDFDETSHALDNLANATVQKLTQWIN